MVQPLTQNPVMSFHILERENDRNYIRWTYPSSTEDLKQLLLTKCFSMFKNENFFSLRLGSQWIYINQWIINDKQEAIVLVTKDYEPIKYKKLCLVFAEGYKKTSNPVEVVKLYLSLCINGNCSFQQNGKVVLFDIKEYKTVTNIKELIHFLGLESVLLYTGALLKRRLMVYHSSVEILQEHLLSISKFIPERSRYKHLYPLITTPKELKGLPYYMIGVTDNIFIDQSHLYDVYVDLVNKKLTMSNNMKGKFGPTKVLKDLAKFLVNLSESDKEEEEIHSIISDRTSSLFGQLDSLATNVNEAGIRVIHIEDIKAKKLNPALEGFLIQLAVAENLLKC